MIAKEIFRTGKVYTICGNMGDGKTFTSIAMMQHCVQGDYELDYCNVEAITNVKMAFKASADERPKIGYPKHVHYAGSMAETLRTVGKILEKYDNDEVLIIWIADETQNYMMADQNFSKETQAMKSFLGNTRKFSMCDFFLSPALSNLPLRIRSFNNGENRPGDGNVGYCSGHWLKDRKWAESRYSKDVALNKVRFCDGPGKPYQVVTIWPTSWTKNPYGPDMKVGDYGYDTRSTATFEVGENEFGVPFDLKEFMKATSDGLYYDVPDQISDFFEKWDRLGSGDDPQSEDTISPQIRSICELAYKALSDRKYTYIAGNKKVMHHTTKDVATWLNLPESTLRNYMKKYLELTGLARPEDVDEDNENEQRKTQNESCAAAVYIQSKVEKGEISPPLAICKGDEGKKGSA